MLRALVDLLFEFVGIPACLVKSSRAIRGELQDAKTGGARSLFIYANTFLVVGQTDPNQKMLQYCSTSRYSRPPDQLLFGKCFAPLIKFARSCQIFRCISQSNISSLLQKKVIQCTRLSPACQCFHLKEKTIQQKFFFNLVLEY